MVRPVRRGSIFADLLMCGGGVRSILLLPLVAMHTTARYLYLFLLI